MPLSPWPLAEAVAALRDVIADGLAASDAATTAVVIGPYPGSAAGPDAATDRINLWPWAVADDAALRASGRETALRLTVLVTCHAGVPERALLLAGMVMAAIAARPVTAAARITAAPVPDALLPLLSRRPAAAPPLCYELRFSAGASVGDFLAQDIAAILQP